VCGTTSDALEQIYLVPTAVAMVELQAVRRKVMHPQVMAWGSHGPDIGCITSWRPVEEGTVVGKIPH